MYDAWKVIESGCRLRLDGDWYGNGGYSQANAFAKYFANRCRDCKASKEVKAKLKEIMEVSIIWQGNRTNCMNSARTTHCHLCLKETKVLLFRIRQNRSLIINNRSRNISSHTSSRVPAALPPSISTNPKTSTMITESLID